MDVMNDRCCGLDVHKKTISACVILNAGQRRPTKQTRTFGTMTGDPLAMVDWLRECGVNHVAMEATGVYWKPVWNVLEGHFTEVLLVNAQHVKAVPGRKTDQKDAEWLADLLQHGLLRGSFIPPPRSASCVTLRGHESALWKTLIVSAIASKRSWRMQISNSPR
jgi:transposase